MLNKSLPPLKIGTASLMVRRPRREFTVADKIRALSLLATGATNRTVCDSIGCSLSTLKIWKRRGKEDGSLSPRPRCGRPKSISPRACRRISRAIKQDPRRTLSDIKEKADLSQCRQTISRCVKSLGFINIYPVKKPLLSQKAVKERLAFVKIHSSDTPDELQRHVFSDETAFEIDQDFSKIKIWTTPQDRHSPQAICKQRSGISRKLMAWGAISASGPGPLVFLREKITGHVYADLLRNTAFPYLLQLNSTHSKEFIFIDDNAPVHRCREVKGLWNQSTILHSAWPPSSPDLNPIEHVWGYLKQTIRRKHPKIRTAADMERIVSRLWADLSQEYCANLVMSFKPRCAQVKAARGKNNKLY